LCELRRAQVALPQGCRKQAELALLSVLEEKTEGETTAALMNFL
jgi:hypothetical protein